jgi:2-polyprenyl-3-methyl-5-hydroxy-6-metoxy-1,4-benzoquinol methylase
LRPAEHFEDPVAAYDRLAPHYAELSLRRQPYLRRIEQIIASRIPQHSKSLLDIGAGDGERALRIARACGIQRLVLLEPSTEMAARTGGVEIWKTRAEDLRFLNNPAERFDVITCLWNVLGHICSPESRFRALQAMAKHLTPNGLCFLDVNHRYNMRAYGLIPSLLRFIRDSISYKEAASDVVAKWNIAGQSISTRGHVFTDREIRRLTKAACFALEERIAVDYDTGNLRRFAFQGNLLYIFRRCSQIDS